jgi:hypothetical protein
MLIKLVYGLVSTFYNIDLTDGESEDEINAKICLHTGLQVDEFVFSHDNNSIPVINVIIKKPKIQ